MTSLRFGAVSRILQLKLKTEIARYMLATTPMKLLSPIHCKLYRISMRLLQLNRAYRVNLHVKIY